MSRRNVRGSARGGKGIVTANLTGLSLDDSAGHQQVVTAQPQRQVHDTLSGNFAATLSNEMQQCASLPGFAGASSGAAVYSVSSCFKPRTAAGQATVAAAAVPSEPAPDAIVNINNLAPKKAPQTAVFSRSVPFAHESSNIMTATKSKVPEPILAKSTSSSKAKATAPWNNVKPLPVKPTAAPASHPVPPCPSAPNILKNIIKETLALAKKELHEGREKFNVYLTVFAREKGFSYDWSSETPEKLFSLLVAQMSADGEKVTMSAQRQSRLQKNELAALENKAQAEQKMLQIQQQKAQFSMQENHISNSNFAPNTIPDTLKPQASTQHLQDQYYYDYGHSNQYQHQHQHHHQHHLLQERNQQFLPQPKAKEPVRKPFQQHEDAVRHLPAVPKHKPINLLSHSALKFNKEVPRLENERKTQKKENSSLNSKHSLRSQSPKTHVSTSAPMVPRKTASFVDFKQKSPDLPAKSSKKQKKVHQPVGDIIKTPLVQAIQQHIAAGNASTHAPPVIVVGTSQKLEKRYLRLTAAPEPANVRPPEVLRNSFAYALERWEADKNYLYTCNQLKSIRQDLLVQRIQTDLTVSVYEAHARIALEEGDLSEFNQCQCQLMMLYERGLAGSHAEFVAYRILYFCYTKARSDLKKLLDSVLTASAQNETTGCVQFALLVVQACESGDFASFARLAQASSSCGSAKFIVHRMLHRERCKAMHIICRAYRQVPEPWVWKRLGFVSRTEFVEFLCESVERYQQYLVESESVAPASAEILPSGIKAGALLPPTALSEAHDINCACRDVDAKSSDSELADAGGTLPCVTLARVFETILRINTTVDLCK